LILFSTVTIIASVKVQAQNIIQNGGFESWVGGIPTFWTLLGGTIHQIPGYTGASCCRLGGAGLSAGYDQYVIISQTVSVAGGAPCTFDFWAKAENEWGALSARAELRWLDSSSALIAQQAVSISGAAWARYGPSVYTAPPTTAFLEIRFVKASWGYLDVDDVSLVAGPAPLPDLTVTSIRLSPTSPVDGASVIFYAMVMNQGTATANNIRIDCYLDGPLYAQGTIGSLSAGASTEVQTTTPWRATQGSHMFKWVVDPANAIAESNEFNNERSMSFIVAAPPFDFSLSATPPIQSVNQGQQATYMVTVTLTSGITQTVSLSLSGHPTGATYSFNPPSGSPTFISMLTVTTPPTAIGTYTLIITAAGGGKTHTAQVTLTVTAQPDFNVAVSPPSQTVLQKKTVTYTVTITPLGGFSAPITLSLVGLPTDADYSFSPVTGWTSTLTVSAGTTTGTFTLTISGTGGGVTRTATASLTISVNPDMQASSDAIENARDAIGRAESEGRTVGLEDAKAKLREAEDAYKAGDYALARSLADEARRLAEEAVKPRSWLEAYGLYIAAALVALIAIAIVGTLFWRKRKAQPKAVKYCISCGAEMPQDAPQCPRCGAKQEQL